MRCQRKQAPPGKVFPAKAHTTSPRNLSGGAGVGVVAEYGVMLAAACGATVVAVCGVTDSMRLRVGRIHRRVRRDRRDKKWLAHLDIGH